MKNMALFIYIWCFLIFSCVFVCLNCKKMNTSVIQDQNSTDVVNKMPMGITSSGGVGMRIGETNLGIDLADGSVSIMP